MFLDLDLILVFYLSLVSLIGWCMSTVTSGGSSMLLMPLIGFSLGVDAIPPVITIGAILGNAERAIAYRKMIRWEVILWEILGAFLGVCLGAFTLSQIRVEFLSVLVAFFLVISAISLLIKNEGSSFTVRLWYFLPAGFIYSWLSAIAGSIGPILTPFYLNYGLSKEELLATQATARFAIHLVKAIFYGLFGILTLQNLSYGILMGIAAFPGNWLGQKILDKISQEQFRQIVATFVILSSVIILWQQFQLS